MANAVGRSGNGNHHLAGTERFASPTEHATIQSSPPDSL